MNRDSLKIGEVYFYRGPQGYFKPVYYQAEIPGGIGRRRMVFMDLSNNQIVVRMARDIHEHSVDCPKYLNEIHGCECTHYRDNLRLIFQILMETK